MRFRDLDSWLRWQETLHPRTIDLGLERVEAVWRRLGPLPDGSRVVTVAGTNGKGSCVGVMERVLLESGRSVLAYTSPHLLRYNERIRLDGQPISDEALIAAFAAVDQARGDTPLTYFEFGTLAALRTLVEFRPDTALLEVGLGGRLDAVNILDPDVAVITSVGLDHMDWLGSDREAIGSEKAGILRPGAPFVLGDRAPPASVLERAGKLDCATSRLGVDYDWDGDDDSWRFEGSCRSLPGLPVGPLGGPLFDNAACALEALDRLPARAPTTGSAVAQALTTLVLPGRLQVIRDRAEWVVDLAHNAPAAAAFGRFVGGRAPARRTHAVFGMLAGKDVAAVLGEIGGFVDRWWLVDTTGERARPATDLAETMAPQGVDIGGCFASTRAAIKAVQAVAGEGDRVLVFGSFRIVGPALETLSAPASGLPSTAL